VEQEGNAREVLRQVRDSLCDGGWLHYRKAEVREEVASVLEAYLADIEEVPPEAVRLAFNRLADVGLLPVQVPDGLSELLSSEAPPAPA
jgi:hypothetical protein